MDKKLCPNNLKWQGSIKSLNGQLQILKLTTLLQMSAKPRSTTLKFLHLSKRVYIFIELNFLHGSLYSRNGKEYK